MNITSKEIKKIKKDFYNINNHFKKLLNDNNLEQKSNFSNLIEKLKNLVIFISNKLLEYEEKKYINKKEYEEMQNYIILLNNYYNLIYQYKYCNQ